MQRNRICGLLLKNLPVDGFSLSESSRNVVLDSKIDRLLYGE